jgi:hypothetical protein
MTEEHKPSKRCECYQPEPEQVTEKITGCSKCGGWVAVSISSFAELEQFTKLYK